jgi:hypothetical protein
MPQTYRGTARNVIHQQKQTNSSFGGGSFGHTYDSLAFRLEQVDPDGNVTGFLQVRRTAKTIADIIADGDDVAVVGRLRRDHTLAPTKITNLRTGAVFPAPVNRWGWGVLAVLATGFILWGSGAGLQDSGVRVADTVTPHGPQVVLAPPAVCEVTTRLRDLGYLPREGSPYAGGALIDAIKRFQRAHNLPADGIAGPQTCQILGSDKAQPAGPRNRYQL